MKGIIKNTLVRDYVSPLKRFISLQNYSIIVQKYHQFLPKSNNKNPPRKLTKYKQNRQTIRGGQKTFLVIFAVPCSMWG